MNPGSRDTPTEENAQRLGSGDGHVHSKAGGSVVMHDHGRHSPASAHSPGVSGKLPGLHPDSSRSSRGFGTPSFSPTGVPGFNLDHLPFLLNTASPLMFPQFLHPSAGSLFPPVLPPNFLPPSLQPPLASLFPSPSAECEVSSGGWSAHSAGSRNTSSLGSTSSEGDLAAKIDGRTVRSSRCSPDVNLQPLSLSSSVRKIWESAAVDPVCIPDVDMPLSLVTRRETTSRGSSVAESGVCTGDSLARAASSETSRTPSLDGESGCHLVGENIGVQEQTLPADQPAQWLAAKLSTDTLQPADDGKSSTNDDAWSTPASRSSGIALPPRKRLTRNAEELSSSDASQSAATSGAASSPSSAPNFRSCWKKFAAKSNVSVPSSHRAFGGKPQYDCRTYFQKLAEQAKAAAASKAFVPGKGKGHCYRNANKTSPRSSDQNTGSPRVTRSQSKPKKTQSPKSSPAEPPAPVRKSTRKKSINTRFEEYDRTGGKNKKARSSPPDSNAGASDGGKENLQAAVGDDVTNSQQRKNRRRGKQSLTDGDSVSGDTEDNTSQSNEVLQPVSDADSKAISFSSCLPAAAPEVSESNVKVEDTVDPECSVVIAVLPPKFRHFKTKTAAVVIDSSQPQTDADRPIAATNESSSLEVTTSSVKSDSADAAATVAQAEVVAGEDECVTKPSLSTTTENSVAAETSGGTLTEESKVNRSHSVGGRKSLLYRSSGAAVDSESSTEAKVLWSQTECSAVVPADTASTADQTSFVETSDSKAVLLDGVSVPEHIEAQSEITETSLKTVAQGATSTEISDKVQSVTDDDQHVEAELSDVRLASPCITDSDTDTSIISSAVSNTASDHPSAPANEDSAPTTELDSGAAASVDITAQTLAEVPADVHSEEADSKSEPGDVSDDVTVTSGNQSVNHRSSETVDVSTAGVVAEPSPCLTSVTDTSDVSCTIQPTDAGDSTDTEESVPQNSESSLKRSLPDEATVNDDSKKRRVDSPDVLLADTVSKPVHDTPDTNAVVNFTSSSDDQNNWTCHVSNDMSEQLQTALSLSAKNSSESMVSKPNRTKSTKTNRRLKLNRSCRMMKTVISTERRVLEKSNHSAVETEITSPAEIKSDKNNENRNPPILDELLDGNHETPGTEAATVVRYTVANSADKVCDNKSDVSSAPSNGEPKVLRISLVALNESAAATHRDARDSKAETVCDADRNTSSSTAATATAASVVNSLKQSTTSVCSPADAEPRMASAGSGASQDSVALEPDSSTLLAQCRSLSVVLEKMQNNRSTPTPPTPPTSANSSTGGQRKAGLARRRFAPAAKPKVTANDSVAAAAEPPLPASSVEDEYRFSDDALPDTIAPQRLPRHERKASSRKARNSLPERIEASPATTGDSTSHCAVSSIDSSVASTDTGGSLTPNAIQKVVAGKPETRSGRSRRRKRNLQDDEDTRSLSPITQNGTSPAAFVEASLDGHKLKLRITKCATRSAEASTCDVAVAAAAPYTAEITDTRTASKVNNEVPVPDLLPTPSVEVIRERVNRKRRQLKVEGVRSRFLTLHKQSGVVPLEDHVKCRLVKVGRRQWMSIGGEEGEDDLPASQHSDTETTPATNSPAVAALVDEIAQQPTRDRLLLVNETKKQRRRGRPPKAKTVLADAEFPPVTAKQNKKRVKTDTGSPEVSFTKPEPLPEVVTRPARVDPVPWLDGELDDSETHQPYCALGDSSSRTIATDIDEYRLNVSAPAEFTSNIDRVISDALSDCGVELTCGTVLTPKSMFFVPSELERLMEALVLDGDLRRQPCLHTPPMLPVSETAVSSSACVGRTFSYTNSVSSPIFSPRSDVRVDLLLSQPSLRPQNCATLPVDSSGDGSDYDCAIVGYEYPACPYPDSVELSPLFDAQFIDEDYMLPSTCLTDPQLYSCVDLVL